MSESWTIFKIASLVFLVAATLTPGTAFAEVVKAGIPVDKIWFSQDPFFAGDTITISTLLVNSTEEEFTGTVEFRDATTTIATANFDLLPKSPGVIANATWLVSEGNHTLGAYITNPKFSGKMKVATLPGSGVLQRYAEKDVNGDRIPDSKQPEVFKQKIPPFTASSSQSTSTKIVASSTPERLLGKLPNVVSKPLIAVTSFAEDARLGEVEWVNHVLADTADDVDRITAFASTTYVKYPLPTHIPGNVPSQSDGWRMMRDSIDRGTLTKSPLTYVRLLIGLMYQYAVAHAWLCYPLFFLIIVKVVLVVVGRITRKR